MDAAQYAPDLPDYIGFSEFPMFIFSLFFLMRMNGVDPDDLSDYLCPSPIGRPSSLHRGVKRGRASSKPLPDSTSPMGWWRKKVMFVLPGEEDKRVGDMWKKSGWAWPG